MPVLCHRPSLFSLELHRDSQYIPPPSSARASVGSPVVLVSLALFGGSLRMASKAASNMIVPHFHRRA